MKIIGLESLAVLLAGTLGAQVAHADTVVLSDGSRLIGTVEQVGGGKLVIATDFAGTLEIDMAKITAIETDGTVHVGLTTGDRLVGPLGSGPEPAHAVVQTSHGPVAISMDEVDAIWPEGGKSPEMLAAEAKAGKWSATLEAGAMFTEGNREILEARGRAELRRVSEDDLLRFYLSGDYGEQSDKRSVAEVKAGAYYEHMISERVFAYGRTEAEYDEFENLDLRFTMVAGGGYYWIKEPEHELKTRAGVGYQHEAFMNGVTTDDAILDLGLDYRRDFAPWLQFVHSTAYFPTFESIRDYRLVSDSAVLIPLAGSDVWKLKFGARYEYDAIPQRGLDRLDQTYYGNVVLELK